MKIGLEVSNGFSLELESGAVYSIRENGSGKLAIMARRENNNIEVYDRGNGKISPRKIGSCHEVILD